MAMASGPKVDLKKYYDTVAACNRCGFCTSYCPTYNASGQEKHSPRGRNQAFRALIEGKLANPNEAKDIIDSCILCGECTSVCFSEVPTADLMIKARDFYNNKNGIPFGLRFVLKNIIGNPQMMSSVLKLAFIGKRIGVAAILQKIGFLQRFFPALANGDNMMTETPLKFLKGYRIAKEILEETYAEKQHQILVAQKKVNDFRKKDKPVPEHIQKKSQERPVRPKVAFMPVCGNQYLRPRIGIATLTLLNRLGIQMMIPKLNCCGLPAASYGVTDQVRSLAKENIKKIEMENFETIIVDDSSCTAHIKEYSKYFEGDTEWLNRAQSLSQKTKEFSQYLIDRGLKNQIEDKKWTKGPVGYHDPCKAQYSQKVTHPPRELLRAIPGLDLVNIPDADQCCGGGGTYNLVYPEMSKDIGAKKINAIIKSGAQTVVTSSASCLLQLQYNLRQKKSQIKVMHLSEILAAQLT